MQLCSFQVLRVLTHFPLPELEIEHCSVWGWSICRQRKGKIGGNFDPLSANEVIWERTGITSALDEDK